MSASAIEEILSGIDLKALASKLDSDPDTVKEVSETAIPTLLGSLQANIASPEGIEGLLGALTHHTGDITDLDEIDTDDGRKILKHAFADDPTRIQALAGQSGGLLSKLLPYLAPLVLSWLAKKVLGGGSTTTQDSGGGLLGGLLGGLFGGGQQQAAPASTGGLGGGLGDILGQVLGGALGGAQTSTAGTTPGQWSIPQTQQTQQTQQSSGGDLLGSLLNQILGG